MFAEVSGSKPDFRALEKRILEFWEKEQSFQKLCVKNAKNARGATAKKNYSFLDGPITANNPMGVHHAWGRTLKDVFQRYKAMQGFDQRYQNGFDCQGLWVEVEVEKDLGLDSKKQILDYGLERFSEACRERVINYSKVIENQSRLLGQWMDWSNSYFTYTDTNIEYIWHFLKTCYERGWLYKGYRAMPWCARCGTSLSQHEMSDSYEEMTHTAVYIKAFLSGSKGGGVNGKNKQEAILVWTTTPWTLTANVALAVHPEIPYVKAQLPSGEILILAKALVDKALKDDYKIIETLPGKNLIGLEYEPFLPILPIQQKVQHRVIGWSEVAEQEGTGIVHIAPGCGAEDYELSKIEHLTPIIPIDEDGRYYEDYEFLSGLEVDQVGELIIQKMQEIGVLYRADQVVHRYPQCWRCKEELVFRLVEEWFISCQEIRPLMIAEAQKVEWRPDYILKRMLDWLQNMSDWCISRKRFWGLPLPFYPCSKCGHFNIIGSKKELEERALCGLDQLKELHRPWIDNVKIKCENCGAEVNRILEVGDCWLDAGIVPFSTMKYFEDHSYWQKWFPVEFICEMREQVRLWFYTLLFMSVTLEGCSPYKKALAHEKVMDEQGQPMHKSLGNAIWFEEAVEKMGADVMRWIYASHPTNNNLRFGYSIADEVRRHFITWWNTYSFFITYANIDQPIDILSGQKKPKLKIIDRWILSKLQNLVSEASKGYEDYDTPPIVRALENFLEDLSNWYVRVNRKRFWKSGLDEDKEAAYFTLFECLITMVKVAAPIFPFITEDLFQNLRLALGENTPESVHLCDFPKVKEACIDKKLEADMDLVRQIVFLGHSARQAASLKVRQPLEEMLVVLKSEDHTILENYKDLIYQELNIKNVKATVDRSLIQSKKVKVDLKKIGPKLGALTGKIAVLAKEWNGEDVSKQLTETGFYQTKIENQEFRFYPEELILEAESQAGWMTASEGDLLVGIKTELTAELLAEGVARDFVRFVQDLRKEADLYVMDRIEIVFSTESKTLENSILMHKEYICHETLADQLVLEKVAVAPQANETYTSRKVKIQGESLEIGINKKQ